MNFAKRMIPAVLSIAGMIILILEPQSALTGASEGIELCLKVVIPSLFPFLILSDLLTESTVGLKLGFLYPACRLCRVPIDAAPLLLIGLTGGYPVGAQGITRAWRNGQLARVDAERMLGFCNNAGPAFIFGMTAGLFDNAVMPWILWLIQISAVLLTGFLLPGGAKFSNPCSKNSRLSPAAVLRQAISAMSSICSWVIVFRIIICYCNMWFLNYLPETGQALVAGILEMTNGCCRLYQISSDKVRFLLCTAFLSFGGLAVYMQTLSVTEGLGTGKYLYGKLLQSVIAIALAWVVTPTLFPSENQYLPALILLPVVSAVIVFIKSCRLRKIIVEK